MASGRVHSAVSLIASPVVGAFTFAFTLDAKAAIYAAAGCGVAGLFVQPDNDTIGYGESGSYPLYVTRWLFGNPIAWLYRLYWTPYSRIVRHRSPISHWPLLGTLGRVVYLIPLYGLFLTLFFAPSDVFLRYCLIGLAVSDVLHWIFDWRAFRPFFPQ